MTESKWDRNKKTEMIVLKYIFKKLLIRYTFSANCTFPRLEHETGICNVVTKILHKCSILVHLSADTSTIRSW